MDISVNQVEPQEQVKNRGKTKSMFKFKTLKSKILFGFGLVILLVVGLVIESSFTSLKIEQEAKLMADYQIPLMIADERAAFSVTRRAYDVRSYLATGDDFYKSKVEETTEMAIPYFIEIGELSDSDTAAALAETHREWSEDLITEAIDVYDRGDTEQAQ